MISVPASIASSLSAGARRGLLLKGGAVIEAAARTSVVAFDKTGTLTAGKPVVTDVLALGGVAENDMLALTGAVEAGSSHPLAEAILDAAKRRNLALPAASESKAHAGKGVEARVGNQRIFVGSPPRRRREHGVRAGSRRKISRLETEGKTVAAVLRDDALIGLIAMRDEPRADAKAAVAELKAMGVRSLMLTGDNARTGAAIAQILGLEARGELMPDDKVTAIRELAAKESVMMIGDGINDAPALAARQRASPWVPAPMSRWKRRMARFCATMCWMRRV